FGGDRVVQAPGKMIPEQRRRLGDVDRFDRRERRAQIGELSPARRARPQVRSRHLASNALGQIDQFVVVQMHTFARLKPRAPYISPSSFLRFPSAWKKLAFTAPTDVPSTSAISWCVISWYVRRTSVARCLRGSRAIAA